MSDALDHIAASRLRNQKLLRTDTRAPEAVVSWLGAVQAQDYPGARWALGRRATGSTDAGIARACDEGRILRIHILRPTWHFVSPADIRWMLSISGPRVNAINAHYYKKTGLDAPVFARSRRIIEKALGAGTHLTRLELAAALERSGIQAEGQRLAYLMMRGELDGVICSGACRGKQFTYALLDQRAPLTRTPSMKRDEALAALATRYFTSHGPATLPDYVWWSGLMVKDARGGIDAAGGALRQETIDGRVHWLADSGPARTKPSSSLHLLPNYDEYLIAYKDRQSIRDRRAAPANPLEFPYYLVIDGKLRGTWKRSARAGRVVIELRLYRPLAPGERRALDAEAARYAKFVGSEVEVDTK
ncbi:MAG TPA: winged helix DNA-binding domain-containing protein [Vicinamibacterales bacterium]|nr:winged helix DNA-binding domain-containing protein [Vicinamibacterales bacterium]